VSANYWVNSVTSKLGAVEALGYHLPQFLCLVLHIGVSDGRRAWVDLPAAWPSAAAMSSIALRLVRGLANTSTTPCGI